jgi:hypothetical protein
VTGDCHAPFWGSPGVTPPGHPTLGDTKGQQRLHSGSRDLAMTSGEGSKQQRSRGYAVYGMQAVRGCDASCLA